MNTNKLRCTMCGQYVDGERTKYVCECGDQECGHETWAAGCWYSDGNTYQCACGTRLTAYIDEDNNAWLKEK